MITISLHIDVIHARIDKIMEKTSVETPERIPAHH